jgi:hypothetical protein
MKNDTILISAGYFTDSVHGYITHYPGNILYTENKGYTWTVLNGGTANLILDMKFNSLRSGYLVGIRGAIIRASDTAGMVWPLAAVTGSLEINPNPAQVSAEILFELDHPSDGLLEILSMNGVILFREELCDLIAGKNRMTLPLGTLASGVYIVTISTAGKTFSGKIVIR